MTTSAVVPTEIKAPRPLASPSPEGTLLRVLAAVSFCHLINDMMQSLLPSIYPILKTSFHLNFSQIGLITLVFQITASLLQPFIGTFTDRRPVPWSLPIGMTTTLVGLVLLAYAPTYGILLIAASLFGIGSAIFHPESSRVARMASGGKHGFAQAFFQVGGNTGSAIGPLLAAFIILPRGQIGVLWFVAAAVAGIVVLSWVGNWYKHRLEHLKSLPAAHREIHPSLPRHKVIGALTILMLLVFSKYFYIASLTSYYTFYLISRFHVSVASSQLHLFALFGAIAAGTLIGGPIGDKIGRKYVIWCSILGVLPFTLMLPYANLFWTGILSVIIGVIIASAFSAILVYAQELVPGRVGMISGLFFGFAFGMGGIGAAVLGQLADKTSIIFVYHVCAYLPAIGLLTGFLPNLEPDRNKKF
ncbi:MFS transporter [Acidicapsa ligni]|uniref:MFS transporter n=1 Tax=Acidicapsa ligni TaxID=542300 RepID=UPI00295C2228|nr:MFS transporter [Acidicapsa ligni]